MIYDAAHGLIYGVVTSASGIGELFVVDGYSQIVSTYNLPSNIHPYEVIHSTQTNATYLYDNTRSGTTYPTLYRVW